MHTEIEIIGRFCNLDAAKFSHLDPARYEGHHLRVNVSQCTYIDSFGLHKILALYKRAKHLVITGANANFMAMLELTRLNQILEIEPS